MSADRTIVVSSVEELQAKVTKKEFSKVDCLHVQVHSKTGFPIMTATMYKQLRHTKIDAKTQKVRRYYRRTSQVAFIYTDAWQTVQVPGSHKPSGVNFKKFLDYVSMRAKQTIQNYG